MLQRCSSTAPPENARMMMRSLTHTMNRNALAVASSTEKLYVKIHYHVLYRSPAENLSLDLIKSQHQMINASFNKMNQNLQKVPVSGSYNFQSVVGDAAIVVLPTDYTKLEEAMITRIETNKTFTGLADVVSWMNDNSHPFLSGEINLVICPLESILGEAEVVGYRTCVTTGSVGGTLLEGSLTPYRLGITAVHEIGHLLGLPHVFDGDCNQTFSDIPSQLYPNSQFQLFFNGTSWDGKLCNRYRDCLFYREGDESVLISGADPPYSCFSCATTSPLCNECDEANFEQACNFMDYGGDDHIVMFSKQQVLFMRQILLSGNTGLTLHSSDGDEVTTDIPEDIVITVDAAQPSTGLSTWVIVGIVLGSITFVVLLTIIVLKAKKIL